MQLYLIRHADTQVNKEVDATNWTLSERGQKQAVALARQSFWKAVDRVALSSEPKTRLTIEPILAQHKLPALVEPRFDELRRDGWVGDYVTQVERAFGSPLTSVGRWEPAAEALQRFLGGIEALVQNHAHETIALVGHGLTLSLYRAYLLRQPIVRLADWQNLSFAAVALVKPVERELAQDFQPVAGQIRRD